MNKRIITAILIISIVLCILASVALCIKNRPAENGAENAVFVKVIDEADDINKPVETADSEVREESTLPAPRPDTEKEGETSPVVAFVGESEVLAIIAIKTEKVIKTYEIAQGVSEDILNRGIGHLPSSALPGQEGVCVLMGHRDTEFKILQYLEIGDALILSYTNESYSYAVIKFEILSSDDELRFESLAGENLVLVTCYPFRYTGHAPQKFVVYAERVD